MRVSIRRQLHPRPVTLSVPASGNDTSHRRSLGLFADERMEHNERVRRAISGTAYLHARGWHRGPKTLYIGRH